MRAVFILLAAVGVAAGQAGTPAFDQYRVTEAAYKGKPAAPVIKTPDERRFRTMIRTGAAKGPNFAGRFTVVEWGCGAGCLSMVVVDAATGEIHRAPFKTLDWQLRKYEGKYKSNDDAFQQLAYRPDSRLLVARGCPDEGEKCASYFWEWDGREFKLIKSIASEAIPE